MKLTDLLKLKPLPFANSSEINNDDNNVIVSPSSLKDSKYGREITEIATTNELTPNGEISQSEIYITSLEENLEIKTPSGNPVNGNTLLIRITDDGTSRELTWSSDYEWFIDELEETIESETIYIGVIYNSTSSKWEVLSINSK